MNAEQVIPHMDHPLGAHWRQPARALITIEGDKAYMARRTLKALPNYAHSNPSGVYPGKMWRRSYSEGTEKEAHFLAWYGAYTDETKQEVTNHSREVVVHDYDALLDKASKI